MSTSFPTALDNFTNPAPTSPRSDHAAQHANANDAIEAIQALLGITGSSDPATITKRVADLMALQSTQPQTLWASGQIFFIPPGDGGANGLLFAGGGTGAFTLSAAVPANFVVPKLWIYLTANAGGSGNPAGWHYATMSSDTAGIVYADRYDSTSEVTPVFPASPTTLNCTSATRLTSTTAELQGFQVPFDAASQMGINGEIRAIFLTGGSTAASAKALALRADISQLYLYSQTTQPLGEWWASVANQGSLAAQICTRNTTSVGAIGAATVTATGLFKTIDLSTKTTLSVTGKLAAVTDAFWFSCKNMQVTYGS